MDKARKKELKAQKNRQQSISQRGRSYPSRKMMIKASSTGGNWLNTSSSLNCRGQGFFKLAVVFVLFLSI
jgi:hypothetical protein